MQELTIKLNHRSYPLKESSTVSSIMAENNYEWNAIIVKINGTVIEEETWQTTKISAGDNVEIIHIFGGG